MARYTGPTWKQARRLKYSVLETGKERKVATTSQMAHPTTTVNIPNINNLGSSANISAFTIEPLIVSVTLWPKIIAPENSQIEAIRMVCPSVKALAPTEVANEFATSLPPIYHTAYIIIYPCQLMR